MTISALPFCDYLGCFSDSANKPCPSHHTVSNSCHLCGPFDGSERDIGCCNSQFCRNLDNLVHAVGLSLFEVCSFQRRPVRLTSASRFADSREDLQTAAQAHRAVMASAVQAASVRHSSSSHCQTQVFCWKDSAAHEEMRKACFDYLRLGGMHADGPMSLLSGLRPQPSILVMHFFMVALFGVGRLMAPFPTPSCVLLTTSHASNVVHLEAL